MPNLIDRYVSQSMVSHLSGIKNDVIRDWRRRDLMNGYGEQQANRRWVYSLHETVELAIVRQLIFTIPTISVCQWIAGVSAVSVVQNFRRKDGYVPVSDAVPTENYLACWIDRMPNEREGSDNFLQCRGGSTIEEAWSQLRDAKGSHAHVVDTLAMANSFEPDLKTVLLYGLAGPGRDGISIQIEGDD